MVVPDLYSLQVVAPYALCPIETDTTLFVASRLHQDLHLCRPNLLGNNWMEGHCGKSGRWTWTWGGVD